MLAFGYRIESGAPTSSRSREGKSAERVHDDTPVSNRPNLRNAAVRIFAAPPMPGLSWTGFGTHSRDYLRHTEDCEMTTSGTGMQNVFLANLVVFGMVGNALWAFALVGAGVAA